MGIYDSTDVEDDFEDDEPQRPPNNSAMRELRKALKASQDQLKQAQEALAEQAKVNRSRSISDVLASKGLSNPKIAKLIPESVEATEESVTAWLNEYADVFGSPAKEESASQEDADEPPKETMDSLRDIDAVSMGGLDSRGASDLMSRIAAANTPEELNAVLRGAAG